MFSGDNSARCSVRLVIPATRTANFPAATALMSILRVAPQPTMPMDSEIQLRVQAKQIFAAFTLGEVFADEIGQVLDVKLRHALFHVAPAKAKVAEFGKAVISTPSARLRINSREKSGSDPSPSLGMTGIGLSSLRPWRLCGRYSEI